MKIIGNQIPVLRLVRLEQENQKFDKFLIEAAASSESPLLLEKTMKFDEGTPADQPKAPKAPTTPAPAPGGGGGGNKKVNMTQDSVKKPVKEIVKLI